MPAMIEVGLEDVDGHPLYIVEGVSEKDFETLLSAVDNAMYVSCTTIISR